MRIYAYLKRFVRVGAESAEKAVALAFLSFLGATGLVFVARFAGWPLVQQLLRFGRSQPGGDFDRQIAVTQTVNLLAQASTYIATNPFDATLIVSTIANAVVLIYLAVKRFGIYRDRFATARKALQIVEDTGIERYSQNANIREPIDPWEHTINAASASSAGQLNIVGATGWDIFGDQKSPLSRLFATSDAR